jgi:hypothetical protein
MKIRGNLAEVQILTGCRHSTENSLNLVKVGTVWYKMGIIPNSAL